MTHTITIRLTEELERWLDQVSRQTGIPKGQFIREQLEKVRTDTRQRRFMRLAGTVDGSPDLSSRKGYAKK
jgi:predicted transcriptional regulator